MTEIESGTSQTHFELSLPMDINQVNNSTRSNSNCIPISAIAGELHIKLTYLLTKINDNNDNKPKNKTKTIAIAPTENDDAKQRERERETEKKMDDTDDTTQQLCEAIISSFVEIYKKYISHSAEYEINIRSYVRHGLIILLDEQFYSNRFRRSVASTSWNSTINHDNSNQNYYLDNKDIVVTGEASGHASTVGIESQLEAYISGKDGSKNENHNHNQNDVIKWLLTQLIVTMEAAILEISSLMHDSYSRYKLREESSFKQAVKLAIQSQDRLRSDSTSRAGSVATSPKSTHNPK